MERIGTEKGLKVCSGLISGQGVNYCKVSDSSAAGGMSMKSGEVKRIKQCSRAV